MAATPLVDRDIEAGRRLVQALDQSDFGLTAAFWNYLIDDEAWRLFLASPMVSEAGPRAAYAAIVEVLPPADAYLDLHDVSVADPDKHLALELRLYAGTDPRPFVGDRHLSKTVVGGVYIEAAYLYRAERIIGEHGVFEMTSVIRDRTRKVWKVAPCRLTVENRVLKRFEVEGTEWRQRQTEYGITTRFDLLINMEKKGGGVYGDVLRLTYDRGWLRNDEIVARRARVEGFHEAHAAPKS